MADIHHISHKTARQFFFEVHLNWEGGPQGIISANDVNETLSFALPSYNSFSDKDWSPEQLLLGSVSASYMSIFGVFAKKYHLTINQFKCDAIGQVELVNCKYQFTHITLYSKVVIPWEWLRRKTVMALQKAREQCLVGNSINARLAYNSEVILEPGQVDGQQ